MKTIMIVALLFSISTFAQSNDSQKESEKKDTRDYGDKQLLQRDTCRKPIEALETKYPDIKKEDLEKMKAKCAY